MKWALRRAATPPPPVARCSAVLDQAAPRKPTPPPGASLSAVAAPRTPTASVSAGLGLWRPRAMASSSAANAPARPPRPTSHRSRVTPVDVPLEPCRRATETSARRTQSADGATSLAQVVGPVTESREAHLQRHGGGLRSCPRCRWYLHGHRWMGSYGVGAGSSSGGGGVGPRGRVVWIAERPARWGGSWALGCVFCADASVRAKLDSPARTSVAKHRRLGSRWARYEVCPATLQAEHIKQHCHYDLHKIAERAYYRPDEPVTLAMQTSAEDDCLLRGAVPQPPDWLRAWHAARTPQSWKAAAEAGKTEHFIHQIRQRAVLPRGLQSMVAILREVVRRRKRKWIHDCSSIALSFDDRQGYKLILFRCDVPFDSALAEAQGDPWRSGIVGCFECLRGTTLSELAEDYAVRTCDQILKLIRAFCDDDEDLYKKFIARVKIIVADGALQKVAMILRATTMFAIILIGRDPAHMIRIACKDPLVRTGRFEEQFKRLFLDKHALIKDIQYSDLWQARLEECQKLVIRSDGSQGGGVTHIMRHMSFAAHRFDSWTDPRRKYACCLNAVALTLADVAGDSRQSAVARARAEKCLDAMTARDILETGIAGDFGEICMRCSVRIRTPPPFKPKQDLVQPHHQRTHGIARE